MKEAVTIIGFIGLFLSVCVLFNAVKNHQGSKVKPLICSIVFGVIMIFGISMLFGGSGAIYDNAKVCPVYNGSATKKIGEYSVCKVPSEECTEEALDDWFFNYVDKNDYNWCMILYSDKDDLTGIYAIKGQVIKDVGFDIDESGQYYVAHSTGKPMYVPDRESKTLKKS